ncbi:peptide-N4-(N-acetyl-beta-glucosaminyl)asparagine amidase A-like [Ziziphus jujuba]|uniref:Peptide-N4-(N-acetyl-beta- glucosaminyl)asparagine amidase A-like n=1 Tax=Ziziphus jujuba TaxID=326968 RepID=A0A6P3ZDM3_ZIZJJ|nr:peptide-N4-(N-acetyl-beta-glucosaminyl)asparagine amidase A-like [Ziziphus jujuba]
MACSIFFVLSIFLLYPSFSIANVHKIKLLRPQLLSQHIGTFNYTAPTPFFEVTKPIELPRSKPCSYLILRHDFGFTYGKPPVFANYNPPLHCPSQVFSKIVLEWKATCKGLQFDRIFGVWLGGVELLRSCTAEPTASGIVWTVEKDITRYYSLLMTNQTLAVFLGNIVDRTYTGVYHVDITMYFYPAEKGVNNPENLIPGYNFWADLILPISQNLPLNDGLWFEIKNSNETQFKEFKIPRNAYRAVLEVYVSFHENDEFWYSNPPNEYIVENNLTDTPGNGPFREVVVSLDGAIVGAIWPFTVIYTGGVDPLLWRPITGIGSFNLPSYDIEITPFLGNILDGKIHKFGFNVTNALNVWFIDANLHLWLDKQIPRTQGKLLRHISLPFVLSLVSDFKDLNATFLTKARRSISSSGWVKSSYGNMKTHSFQNLCYSNSMVMGSDGNTQIVNQTIHFNDAVHAHFPSSFLYLTKSHKTFLLVLSLGVLDQGDDAYISVVKVTLGLKEKKSDGPWKSSLENLQNGLGYRAVKSGSVVGAGANTQQVYDFDDGKLCYFRNISSSNYRIVYDYVRNKCSIKTVSVLGSGLGRLWLSTLNEIV